MVSNSFKQEDRLAVELAEMRWCKMAISSELAHGKSDFELSWGWDISAFF
jgi:hypothetical protein